MSQQTPIRDTIEGTYSRAYLRERLLEEVDRTRRYGETFSLLFLDLDGLAQVDDRFGEPRVAGILTELAQRLRSTTRNSDLLFRYSKTEFLLLLPNTPKERALILAKRLLEAISTVPFSGEPPLSLTVSLGVASYPEEAQSPEELFERADLRLFAAKREGGGQIASEDAAGEPALRADEAPLPIHSGGAREVATRFLEALPIQRRGALVVAGPPDSGRARVLNEIEEMARAGGYAVMSLRGNALLRSKPYGALSVLPRQWPQLTTPARRGREFHRSLAGLAREGGWNGLFFVVHEFHEVDVATIDLLRELLDDSEMPNLGVAYGVDARSARRSFPFDVPLGEAIELRPLARGAVVTWLQHLLGQTPPPDFSNWLYDQTDGLPGRLHKGVSYLLQRGLLRRGPDRWVIGPDYMDAPLGERLAAPRPPAVESLPLPLTGFVGREAESTLVKEAVVTSRLVTITGAGGIGKSRLAAQVAAEIVDDFRHGIAFVALVGASSVTELVSAIAHSCGFSFGEGREPPVAQLLNYLREKALFLVLDDLPSTPASARVVGDILDHAPDVAVLVTARSPVGHPAELAIDLSGLETEPRENRNTQELPAAVELLQHIARRRGVAGALTGAGNETARDIARLVEGVPLALELVGGWLSRLPLAKVADESRQAHAGAPGADVRRGLDLHPAAHAALWHSWRLLDEEERQAFARLAVFEGSFSAEAATAVAECSPQRLAALVEFALLTKRHSGRYDMHPGLAEFGRARLRENRQEKERVHTLHCHYFIDFLAQRESGMAGLEEEQALAEVGVEIENIRAAWERAVARLWFNELSRGLEGLALFYTRAGWFEEGAEVLGLAAARLCDQGVAVETADGEAGALLGRLVVQQGAFEHGLCRYGSACSLLSTSLEIARRLDLPGAAAFALGYLADIARIRGDYDEARRLANESLDLARANGDRGGMARALEYLGTIAFVAGDYDHSKELYHESLAIHREAGNRRASGRLLVSLGNLAHLLGEYDDAGACYEESAAISKVLGDRAGLSGAIDNLGALALEQGAYQAARRFYTSSLAIREEIGDRRGRFESLINLTVIALHLDEHAEARELGTRSLGLARDLGDPWGQATALIQLGHAGLALGDHPGARRHFHEAVALAHEARMIPKVLEALVGISGLLAAEGRTEEALSLLNRPLAHRAMDGETRRKAALLRGRLEQSLPAPRVNAIGREAEGATLDDLVERILMES